MTATTSARPTPHRAKGFRAHPIKGTTKILAGTLCVLDAGYAKGGASATGLLCIGRARQTYDNTDGTDGLDANGAAFVGEFEFGEFLWANGDSIVQADVGKVAYVTDNQTVTKDGTSKSVAGEITAYDARGVFVYTPDNISSMIGIGASTGATLSSSSPQAVGVAAAGSGSTVSKSDHVHPITCLPIEWVYDGDSAAATTLAEKVIHVQLAKGVTIASVKIYPTGNVTHNASTFATITVKQRTSGGGAATVATLDTSANDWTAFTAVDMGAITNATLAAASQLTITIAKASTGVQLPSFVVAVNHTT